jgi:hypothetical protein
MAKDPDPARYLGASDYAFVEAARRRGGERAAQKMIRAISTRVANQMVRDKKIRQAMMADDGIDHAFPNLPFLHRPVRLPKSDSNED